MIAAPIHTYIQYILQTHFFFPAKVVSEIIVTLLAGQFDWQKGCMRNISAESRASRRRVQIDGFQCNNAGAKKAAEWFNKMFPLLKANTVNVQSCAASVADVRNYRCEPGSSINQEEPCMDSPPHELDFQLSGGQYVRIRVPVPREDSTATAQQRSIGLAQEYLKRQKDTECRNKASTCWPCKYAGEERCRG